MDISKLECIPDEMLTGPIHLTRGEEMVVSGGIYLGMVEFTKNNTETMLALHQMVLQAPLLLAEVRRLREALEYYANNHALPDEGPWGVNSSDFGQVARAALEEGK